LFFLLYIQFPLQQKGFLQKEIGHSYGYQIPFTAYNEKNVSMQAKDILFFCPVFERIPFKIVPLETQHLKTQLLQIIKLTVSSALTEMLGNSKCITFPVDSATFIYRTEHKVDWSHSAPS
jgi:hypothetical protein